MRLFEAIHQLNEAIRASADDNVKSAWLALIPHLLPGPAGGFPPSDLAAASHEALELAEQFHKTGVFIEWQTPPKHSQAIERLIHRLTVVLERLLDLYDGGATWRPSAAAVDDLYQTAFCDDCGAELDPAGHHQCSGVSHVC